MLYNYSLICVMTNKGKTTETNREILSLVSLKKEKSQMGFNREVNTRPSKIVVLSVITEMCLKLKRQVSILEVSDQLRNDGYDCTPEDVRHRMQDIRKMHKKAQTEGSYTKLHGFIATSKTSIIQWDKDGTTPIEYFVGKATAKEVKRLSENV